MGTLLPLPLVRYVTIVFYRDTASYRPTRYRSVIVSKLLLSRVISLLPVQYLNDVNDDDDDDDIIIVTVVISVTPVTCVVRPGAAINRDEVI